MNTSKTQNGKTAQHAHERAAHATPARPVPFDPDTLLAKGGEGRSVVECPKSRVVFAQGDKADAVFFLQKGKVKLTVVSKEGKEAVVAILGQREFFGEGCLTAQPLRMATATALTLCSVLRLERSTMLRLLHAEPAFAERFITHLLARNIRIEEDLVDQLFNSAEKRLARVLLLLANFGKEGKTEPILPRISQETFADMIGTTRSRVSFFMNKFRKLGFIDYNGGMLVHSSLLNIVLHD